MIIPLECLRADETGHIYEVNGDAALVHRLDEMGVRAGAMLRMVRPGESCIVLVNNHRLSLRADGQQLAILVQLAGQMEATG